MGPVFTGFLPCLTDSAWPAFDDRASPREIPMPIHSPAALAQNLTLQLHAYPVLSMNGRAVPLKLKHGLALLAYLSEQRGPVGRETLAALLWPESGTSVGRARLRRLVHTLHGALGGSLVEGDADALWLGTGWHSDIQATRAAIAHAHGAAVVDAQRLAPLLRPQAAGWLDGFTLDAEPFSEWQDSQRRVQQAAVQRALEHAAERAVAQRDAGLAERIAAALLQLDSCAEAGHIALLQARGLRGDAAGVETAYFECAQALRREFGVRPSAAVEAAYARAVAATASPQRTPGGHPMTTIATPTSTPTSTEISA
jgi:DNA-binding SARP family transcriptional activator